MANLSMSETSSTHSLPMRYADFPSLVEALDYASRGDTGMNFYDRRNQLTDVLEYRKLRDHAVTGAKRLLSLGLKKGDRVALIAETSVGFVESFFACQYAGLVAVPLAIPMGVGQRASYITKLQGLINSCAPAAIISSEEWVPLITSATEDAPPTHILSNDDFHALPEADIELQKPAPEDIAYLQYTSGSTRFPRGVIITQRSVMANLQVISHDGIKLRAGDRCVSWLPFYHDMGLVGFLLTPVATQLSVDYLRTQDFAMRPLQWLKLIDKNRGTVTVAPPFGYDLSLRRSSEKEISGLDLSCLRVAGVGAEPIPVELLNQFSEHFSAIGFNRNAFMPCYGLAENTLAVSFSDENKGAQVNEVDRDILEYEGRAVAPTSKSRAISSFVNCGKPLPGHRIEIRSETGEALPEQQVGHICISGPSLMSGYFRDPVTQKQIQTTGWMDTGDLGYQSEGYLYVTGRKKDLIIIRGRNIWPQDIEYVAESEPEIHAGDAIAFVTEEHGESARIILQIQCRVSSEERRGQLVHSLSASIQSEFGIAVDIELLPPHSIPRTSSGKPARAEAKKRWMTSAIYAPVQMPGFVQ
ncbi:acyl-CoA synthetase [Tatumella morbirosei]|uniref:Acyl-CoA synthetase n=2 Tax=Tatumella morbirosei TaxID=642227 RepID=A0A095TB55_9GAMM|nr:acyl-CoA synthetase [Tatumella morbirosei]